MAPDGASKQPATNKEDETMKGTEKQIKWAEEIKANALNTCDRNIEVATSRYNDTGLDMYKTQSTLYKIAKATFEKAFAGIEDASTIIDMRHMYSGETANRFVTRMIEQINKGRITIEQIAKDNGVSIDNGKEDKPMTERTYGTDKTSLALTEKAQQIYDDNCLMEIYEHEGEDGNLTYSYTTGGPETERMSADELIRELEEMTRK